MCLTCESSDDIESCYCNRNRHMGSGKPLMNPCDLTIHKKRNRTLLDKAVHQFYLTKQHSEPELILDKPKDNLNVAVIGCAYPRVPRHTSYICFICIIYMDRRYSKLAYGSAWLNKSRTILSQMNLSAWFLGLWEEKYHWQYNEIELGTNNLLQFTAFEWFSRFVQHL